MDTFQIAVLLVATVILIFIFVAIGLLIKYSDDQIIFPPRANNCPDFWTTDTSGNCTIPSNTGKNPGKLYNGTTISLTADPANTSATYTPGFMSSTNSINFSDDGWSSDGKVSMCAKKNWTTTNGISWDGVSNYNGCKS